MLEITFKYKEKRIPLFFEIGTTNNQLYEKLANELELNVNQINLMDVQNNNERFIQKSMNETIIVERVNLKIKI